MSTVSAAVGIAAASIFLGALIAGAAGTMSVTLSQPTGPFHEPATISLGATASGVSSWPTPPAGAIEISPGQNIQSAVNANPTGTVFLLKAGVHRMQSIVPKEGNEFYGELGANGERLTTLNGSSNITSFGRSGELYTITGQAQAGQVHGDTEAGWEGSRYAEDFFMDSLPLKHVCSVEEVLPGVDPGTWFFSYTNIQPGIWFFDYTNNIVYFANNPTGKTVEIGFTRTAFTPNANNVKICNLIIEKYSIPPQMGAIGDQYNTRSGWVVDNNEVRLNHGTGINIGPNSVVRRNYIHHNGQKGLGASGTNIVLEANEISFNNYCHINSGWEAGGSKFSKADGLTVRDNYVHDNYGYGLWTDIDNINIFYEGNVVYHNRDAGIFHEISYAAIIRNNYSGHNGEFDTWLWGASIQIAASRDVQVYSNTVEVDADYGHGIALIQQNRGTGMYGDWLVQNVDVHDNTVIFRGTGGQCGAVQDNGTTLIFTSNHFRHNSYFYANSADYHFAWSNGAKRLSQFQALGQDTDAVYSATMPAPLDWPALGANAIGQSTVSVAKVEFFSGASKLGEDATYPYAFTWTNVPAGSYSMTARATGSNGATATSEVVFVTVDPPPGQSPYGGSARSLPGQIEAEHYDNGGEGIAYHDADQTNNGGATLRNDGVDIKDAGGGNYVIGWNQPGEWREYAANISNRRYRISARVSTVNTGVQQRVLLGDGSAGSNFVVLGTMDIANTGSYDTFQEGVLDSVTVTNGGSGRVLRLENLGDYFDMDWIKFDVASNEPPVISIAARSNQTGMIELSWTSVPGTTYAVYKSTNLLEEWPAQPLTNNITGDGTTKAFSEPTNSDPCSFYRLKAL